MTLGDAGRMKELGDLIIATMLGIELWLPVDGADGYSVSNLGRVRSESRTITRSDGRVTQLPRRILKGSRGGQLGYRLAVLGTQRREYVHRLVLEAFLGPCPDGMQCRHLDGDRENNRVYNLVWGTPAENYADKIAHGTDTRGERNHGARLTDAAVIEIRQAYARGGVSQRQLAEQYGVGIMAICQVVNRRTWRHL